MTALVSPAGRQSASVVSAPTLNYARPRCFARLRRWMGPGSPLFFLLILALAGAGTRAVWKWRLKADEKAFNERTYHGPGPQGWISFSKPPNAAALRHLNRLPGTWNLHFWCPAPDDPAALSILRSRRWSGVKHIMLLEGPNADAWLKELARPDTGFTSLACLELQASQATDLGLKELTRPDTGLKALTTLNPSYQVTDACLKELARPDSGLKALTSLQLFASDQVTDAGLKELTRPDTGLKVLTNLCIWRTKVTDAGLKELARPDCGLKALTHLGVNGTRVTDAGIAELKKARPGLTITGH